MDSSSSSTDPALTHLLDQLDATLTQIAPVLARYYAALVRRGLPPRAATELVGRAQDRMTG